VESPQLLTIDDSKDSSVTPGATEITTRSGAVKPLFAACRRV